MAKSVLGKNPLERTRNGGSQSAAKDDAAKAAPSKPAAKKPAAKKTVAKKPAAKKPAVKKTAPRKATGGKTAAAPKVKAAAAKTTKAAKPVKAAAAAKKPAVAKKAAVTKTASKKPAAPKTAVKQEVQPTATPIPVAAAPVEVATPVVAAVKPARPAKTAPEVSWRSKNGDGYGYDPEYERRMKGILDTLFSKYWRAEIEGIENIPSSGKVLLVANHAGMLPYDSLMIREAVLRHHPEERLVRPLLEDFVYYFPFLGTLMGKLGSVRACQENGQSLLDRGDAVLVFPEGIKGIEKPYKMRYRLQRFGRGGFIRLAINTRAPIVPVAVIGSEETHPVLANFEQVAKILGLPYLPLTPTFPLMGALGLIPLPSKWKIVFGKPIPFDEYAAEQAHDRILVNKLVERVRSRLQSMIDKELATRKSVWRG